MKWSAVILLSFVCFVIARPNESEPSTSARACEPNTEFTKDCSSCKCNADGSELTCEKKDCPENEETQKASEVTPETATEETCTPGELYKNDCNECKCPESGKKSEASCTIIGCHSD